MKDSPKINEGKGLFLVELSASYGWCVHAQSLSCVWLCDPIDCTSPGSSAQGISQTRILECVGIWHSRGSPHPGTEPVSPALQADFHHCTIWAASSHGWTVLQLLTAYTAHPESLGSVAGDDWLWVTKEMPNLAYCLTWKILFIGLFFWYWAPWTVHKFWRLIPASLIICKYFLPYIHTTKNR